MLAKHLEKITNFVQALQISVLLQVTTQLNTWIKSGKFSNFQIPAVYCLVYSIKGNKNVTNGV
jgi:hypothetical protein